jgi:phenylpropionate dioxygenase-like ring-hydroxylating dioxygenase large terminal subunit
MFNFTYYSNFIKSLFKSERTSLLPRSFYISDHILKRENKYLFGKLWIFAGLKNEIPDDGCWMIKKIGFKEVIIINDKDQYYAHENVCPHRNKRLKVQDYGRGPLVCGYHAWSFKPNGDLNKIPNFERSYLLTENQIKKACLTSYKVELLGNFIFINLSENPIPNNEQFDTTILKSLKLLSQRLHKSYAKLKETRKFNWKLNFENLRDAMHPEVVHATTLANNVDFSEQYVQQKPLTESLRKIELSECSYFSKDGEPKEGQKGHLDDLIKPSFGRGYYNWVLFPNFHMASPDGGRTYYI